MSIQFKKAERRGVHLMVGLSGASGSGKTYSALRLAKGMSGDKPFALIDTEAGRALHYAGQFNFDHCDLGPPFSPARYLEAIVAAEESKYQVIVVDSFSHEHNGEGGLLDMQEAELHKMAGDDYAKRERVKMASWIKPKTEHKRMVARLLQLRSHLILCFRAEPKVAMVKDAKGKMQIVDKGWQPIVAKGLDFEMTLSYLLSFEHPGLADQPIKLPEPLKGIMARDQLIDESMGKRLAEWAKGGTEPASKPQAKPETDLTEQLEDAAAEGMEALEKAWKGLTAEQRKAQGQDELERLKKIANVIENGVS